jgi:hypothetical protein
VARDPFEVRTNAIARFLVTLIVLVAALVVLFSSGFDAEMRAWATGAIGIVIGYWLR